MKNFRKEGITNFVRKNFFEETSNAQKNIVQDLLKKSIGPNENGLILLLKDGEGCLTINQKGNIFGPS